MARWQPERPVARHCDAPDCRSATRSGKPFCPKHVDRLPYVQELLGKIANREAEEARVRDQGPRAVDPEALTSKEVVQFLRVNGKRSVPRLARDLNLDFETLDHYVDALIRHGQIELVRIKRRARIIQACNPPRRRRRKKRVANPAKVVIDDQPASEVA